MTSSSASSTASGTVAEQRGEQEARRGPHGAGRAGRPSARAGRRPPIGPDGGGVRDKARVVHAVHLQHPAEREPRLVRPDRRQPRDLDAQRDAYARVVPRGHVGGPGALLRHILRLRRREGQPPRPVTRRGSGAARRRPRRGRLAATAGVGQPHRLTAVHRYGVRVGRVYARGEFARTRSRSSARSGPAPPRVVVARRKARRRRDPRAAAGGRARCAQNLVVRCACAAARARVTGSAARTGETAGTVMSSTPSSPGNATVRSSKAPDVTMGWDVAVGPPEGDGFRYGRVEDHEPRQRQASSEISADRRRRIFYSRQAIDTSFRFDYWGRSRRGYSTAYTGRT